MTRARDLSRITNNKMTVYKYTATSGQTTFVDSDDNGLVLSYNPNNILVTYNGVVIEQGSEFTASNGTSIVLTDAADSAAEVNIITFEELSYGGVLPTSGGILTGDVTINAALNVQKGIVVSGDPGYPDALEGGQILLKPGQNWDKQFGIDNYADRLRFYKEDDGTGLNGLELLSFDSDGTITQTQKTSGNLPRMLFAMNNDSNGIERDWNTELNNSISYAVGNSHTNSPIQGYNSTVLSLSTKDIGGMHSTSNYRGAQLWFTDVGGGPNANYNSGFYVRPNQGTSGWHPWETVLTTYNFRRNFAQSSTPVNINSTTWTDIGVSVQITPHSTASRFLIFIKFGGYFSATGVFDVEGRLLRDTTQVWTNDRIAGNNGNHHETSFNVWVDHPNTTSQFTYKLQCKKTNTNSGTWDANHGNNESQILVMEFEG